MTTSLAEYLQHAAQCTQRRTITALAAYLNLPRPTLSLYYNGLRLHATPYMLSRLSRILGLSVQEIAANIALHAEPNSRHAPYWRKILAHELRIRRR